MTEHYDVIIVGTGAGGGTLATRWPRRASGSCCWSGATSCPGRWTTGIPGAVFVDGKYISPDTWYDADGKPFQPQVALLRRRRHEAVRRRAVPAAARGLRRDPARRRRVPGLAAELRRLRALVHQGRVAVPGARRARRGPDRGPLVPAVPVARRSRTSRGSSRSPTAGGGRATTRSTRRAASCSTRPTGRPAPASAAPGATATRAWCTPSPTPRPSRCARCWTDRTSRCWSTPRSSGCETDRRRRCGDRRGGHPGRRARGLRRPTSSWSAPGRPTAPGSCCAPASDRHPNGPGQRLGPGRPQLHVPQQQGRGGAGQASRTTRSSRRRSA